MMGGIVIEPFGREASCFEREGNAGIFFDRVPRPEASLNLIGKNLGITCREKHFLCPHARGGVVAMSVGGTADKYRGDDQRTREPDSAHDIVKDAIFAPLLYRFG